jgi:hypothetical protein
MLLLMMIWVVEQRIGGVLLWEHHLPVTRPPSDGISYDRPARCGVAVGVCCSGCQDGG